MATPVRILVTVGTTRFDALIGTVLSARFLSALPNGAHVTVQYGRSSIGEILATSSLVDIDAGSSLEPEPGLRVVNGRRVYQHRLASLDPGHTGTVRGLQIRPGPNGIEGAFQATTPEGVELDMFPFAPDLGGYMKQVDVVISHAGSGTIIETLRVQPNAPALIAVANTSLMDNHQVELVDALAEQGYLIAGQLGRLGEQIQESLALARTGKIEPFPPFEPSRFAAVVDSVMGF